MPTKLLTAAAVAAALLASACGHDEAEWTRPGATAEDVKRDKYWCTRYKRDRYIKMGSKSTNELRPGTKAIDHKCMRRRGYKVVKK